MSGATAASSITRSDKLLHLPQLISRYASIVDAHDVPRCRYEKPPIENRRTERGYQSGHRVDIKDYNRVAEDFA